MEKPKIGYRFINKFRMFLLNDSCPPITDSDIDVAEAELGLKFPESYRKFLLQNNGGRPTPNVFSIQGDPTDNFGILNWLYCLANESKQDLIYKRGVFDERIPAEVLAVGNDPGGNQIYIAINGENLGKIYFWDHEDEVEDGAEPDYENVYLIADSFEGFINNLQDESVFLET